VENKIEIISYNENFHEDFRRLNLEWLDKYNLTESHDLMVLNNPKKTILDRGGYIWLAKAGEEIVGTAALMKEGHGIFELAKMSVTKNWQGKGISKQLIETCLKKAKEMGAKTVTLFSNHQLRNAVGLYEKYGFQHVEVKDSPFEKADVKMELTF
jgi:N-acetylglutamate synthase-like GNAT family acetyltransferase